MTQPKILVADDDPFTLSHITHGLSEAGYRIISAQDGDSAVQLGLNEQPDLAILDICMPGMTGIEAARELRLRGQINTLYLSAHTDREIVETATREGALGYLVKPVNAQQMIPAIEAALRHSEELETLQRKRADLSDAISRNREISIAVGIYMERFEVQEQRAFEALRAYARSRQKKLAAIARELVDTSRQGESLIDAIHQYHRSFRQTS